MTTYVALLYSIVLTKERRVGMTDLRAMAEELGFKFPRTLVSTGNLVFETRATSIAKLESKLESAFEKTFGKHVDIIVRDAAGWRTLLAANPFPRESAADGSRVITRVSRDPIDHRLATVLQPYLTKGERVRIIDGDLWMLFAGKPSESKLASALTPKRLGGVGTSRAWSTLRGIGDLLEGGARSPAA